MISPRIVPSTVPIRVAAGQTNRMYRDPTMARDSTSRPIWSVPNRCAPDGAWLTASSCWSNGLYGAIRVPNTAHTTQNSRMVTPIRNVGLRSSSRHGAGAPDREVCATATAAAGGGAAMSVTRLPRPAAAG
jgi:hypothetical protein